MQKGKRKNSDPTVQSSKKKKSADDTYTEKSTFTELVVTAGMILKNGHSNNQLNVDQAVFQRNLALAFKRHENSQEAVEEFLEGFESYTEDLHRLNKSLMASVTSQECDSARYAVQDSLVRILLGIDILQPKLMTALLERLPLFMDDEDSIFEQGERIFIPRVLLSQFRWLDRIVNCKELATKMLEMIDASSPEIQREIILCLPEVVEDTEHGDVAQVLSDMLLKSNQMTVPVLDALSNLTLKPELLTEVRGSVLKTLDSVEMDDLPVVIKFLLQTVTSQDSLEVVGEIRASLDFKTPSAAQNKANKKSRLEKRPPSDSNVEKGNEALTLDAIKSGIRFQKTVAEAWIKAIDSLKDPADHKVIDIFVLLILHATNRKKPVESLFRNKIRSGAFTEALLQSAFSNHAQILREYFPSILSLAEVLLRSPEPGICYFACAMYRHTFATFDRFCKQEIVGNLVTHIGSGFAGEIDASLDILSDLVHHHLSSMAPFAIFVKGVLDYLDSLTMTQIRKLYSMLSRLAFNDLEDGGGIQDDLHIIIRKQLYNSSMKYKRMGVIGAIMVVRSIAYVSPDSEDKAVSEDQFKQVINLLQLVRSSSNQNPETTSLFMDELSSVISKGDLAKKVVEWIAENMIAAFQDDYVVDVEESNLKRELMVPLKDLYCLNEESESSIAINILPLTIANSKKKKQKETSSDPDLMCLPPHFRLLHISEKQQNDGDLEGIDALLGCPMYTVSEEVYDKYESLSDKEKEVICTTLFHSINWFREVINCFATQANPEMKGKVIIRLQNLTDHQKTLERCLAVTPGYRPPIANFDLEEGQDAEPPNTGLGGADGRKKGRKPKKKKQSNKENLGTDSDENSKDSTQLESQKGSQMGGAQLKGEDKEEKCVDLSKYTQYFRELDVSVFTILNTGLITKAALDSEMNTKATVDLQIQPPQLEFLLFDLTRKLNHSLLASATKRRTFLKTKGDKNVGFSHLDQYTATEIATNMVHLLPALSDHLEGTSAFFQTLMSDNDGLVDGPGSNSPEALLMASCFRLLLQCLRSLFSWNGFVMVENRQLLKDGLNMLTSRIKTNSSSQASFHDLVRGAFNYCQNFSVTVPNLPVAVTLLKLLMALTEKSDLPEVGGKVAELAEEFLKREWHGADGQREKGAKHNEQLQIVIKTLLVYSKDPLDAIEDVTKGTRELIETDKNGCSKTYASLNKFSFAVYYRVLFSELIEVIKRLPAGTMTESRDLKVERLLRWNSAVRILHIFVNLIKTFDGRSNLGTALKYGRMFLEVFLRQGMPLMDCMFKTNQEDVQSLLKSFQMSTRALHHVSSHTKIMRDVALTTQIPMLKRLLEVFVYRVKAMLTINKCLDAFWMGNLKNRDLQGEEILSQASTIVSSDDDDDDGPAVPDDDDEESEVEMDNQSEAGRDSKDGEGSDNEGSYSEVF